MTKRKRASKARAPSLYPFDDARRRTPPSTGAPVGFFKKLAFSVVTAAAVLGAGEGALRIAGFRYEPRRRLLWKPTVAETIGTLEIYIPTEFCPPGYLWVSQPNTELTDRYGFRKPEIPFEKPPDKIRVAFLGGSTTQAGMPPYPERTIRLINAALGTNLYEQLNVACSSYSTHQSRMALERWVLPRRPDIVVVYHGWNDAIVAGDGFSDHEKDFLLPAGGGPRLSEKLLAVRNLRWAQLLGRLADAADRGWPRPRVPPQQFRANLRHMARACRERGIRFVLFTRPASRRRPLPARDPIELEYYRRRFGTDDLETLYEAIHRETVAIQKEVAQEVPGAELFDAAAVLDEVQQDKERGVFGPGVEIFVHDACHLYPIGNQRLAEELALFLAPQHADKIRRHVESPAYHEFLARELLADEHPHEAAYYARRALAGAPDREAELRALIAEAESRFEFAELFRRGRWGGEESNFDRKMECLRRCLALRPSDFGVLLQMFRVCLYSGRLEAAAEAMADFRPSGPQETYSWLSFTFQSHLAAKRWGEAGQIAAEILRLNPSDPAARAFLSGALGRSEERAGGSRR